ncbi:MAG: hypothetical protein DWQ06_13590, partial [Calditrichaeota bacterium]
NSKKCSLCGKRGYKMTFLPSLETEELTFEFAHEKCHRQYFKMLNYSFKNDTIEKRKKFLLQKQQKK